MSEQVDFEKAFSEFLDNRQYDDAENALFTITRASFEAGWKAAGGQMSKSDNIVRLIRKNNVDS